MSKLNTEESNQSIKEILEHYKQADLMSCHAPRILKLCSALKTCIETLTKLRDCDWVISLPDRMDAVRDMADKTLKQIEWDTK